MYGYASSAPPPLYQQPGHPQQQTMYGTNAIQLQQELLFQQQQGWQQHLQQPPPQALGYQQAPYQTPPNPQLRHKRGFVQGNMQQANQVAAAVAPPATSTRPMKRAKQETQQAYTQQQQPHQYQQYQQQHQQQHQQQPVRAGQWLDKLQDDIMQFVQQALPSAQEQQERQAALDSLTDAVHAALGSRANINVVLFGSSRAGLALHSSDMDIMVTGVCEPTASNGGYEKRDKMQVANYLRVIEREAGKRLAVQKRQLISGARIPLLKLGLRNGLELDVSLNNTAGLSAANFLQSWQQDYRALQPLVLVLKSVLKQNGLGDVATGGLGSWSLSNMAIAHLMAEEAAGGQVDHVGHMLFSFLRRFGTEWNVNRDAVAVGEGGVVKRFAIGLTGNIDRDKLVVKDPLTGREVAGGSHRYADVAELWRQLYEDMESKGPRAAARVGGGSGQLSTLNVILDCNAVLRRAASARNRGPYGGGGNNRAYAGSDRGYGAPQGGSLKRHR